MYLLWVVPSWLPSWLFLFLILAESSVFFFMCIFWCSLWGSYFWGPYCNKIKLSFCSWLISIISVLFVMSGDADSIVPLLKGEWHNKVKHKFKSLNSLYWFGVSGSSMNKTSRSVITVHHSMCSCGPKFISICTGPICFFFFFFCIGKGEMK